jgi:hypothetical protein
MLCSSQGGDCAGEFAVVLAVTPSTPGETDRSFKLPPSLE